MEGAGHAEGSTHYIEDDLGVADPPVANESLDDKLLDSVLPRQSMGEAAIEEEIKPAICTRCRTISASFLSSSYLMGSGEAISGRSHEQCRSPEDSNSRFYLTDPPEIPPLILNDDDVPLLSDEDGMETRSGELVSSSLSSDHCHIPRVGYQKSRQAMRKLIVACCLTSVFLVAEAIGGFLANSIAIMSDAAHLLSDLTSFIVSLSAICLSMRPASKRMNFGYYRAEVLGAVVSVLIIWVVTGILVYAAVQRVITMDFEVEADTMIIVAAIGVLINIILGLVLHTGQGHSHHGGFSHGHSHNNSHQHSITASPAESHGSASNHSNVNVRAAFIHVLGDLLQSIGVLIAAYVIRFYPEYKIADPICTFIFSILVLITTVPILRDLSIVLMEGTPPGIEYANVCANLTALPGVKMVHSLHVWALTLDKNACSVHLAIGPDTNPDLVLRDAQRLIRSRHHIFHTTIQVERYQPQLMDNCQQCQPLT